MAFGDFATLLDDFTRADADPISGNWLTLTNAAQTLRIISNQVSQTNDTPAQARAYWTAATFGANCEAWVTVHGSFNLVSNSITVTARIQSPGTGIWDGYEVSLQSTTRIDLRIVTNGTATVIATSTIPTFVAGEGIGIRCLGTTIEAVRVNANSVGTPVTSVTDNTYMNGGFIAVGARDPTAGRLDNFRAGTITNVSIPDQSLRPRAGWPRR